MENKSAVIAGLIAYAVGMTSEMDYKLISLWLELYTEARNEEEFKKDLEQLGKDMKTSGYAIAPLTPAEFDAEYERVPNPASEEQQNLSEEDKARSDYLRNTPGIKLFTEIAPAVNFYSENSAYNKSDPPIVKRNVSAFCGGGGRDKKAIYEHLKKYRAEHGLGSFETLAKASGGKLTATEIADMYAATPYKLEKWLALGKALDKVEKKETKEKTEEET